MQPWKSYKPIPQSQKNFWFEELKRVYWWDCPDTLMQNIFNSYATSWLSKTFAEARVAGAQPNWFGDDIWHDLQAYWDSDEFKAKSTKNKVNRVANPIAANNVYRGSLPQLECIKGNSRPNLVVRPNRWRYSLTVIKRRRTEPGVGSGPRRSCGKKWGQVFGMGSDALMLDAAQPWTTKARSSSSTAAPSPTDTKLDKIILVLSALCTKMGMLQIFSEVQSTTDAPIDGTAQQAAEDATHEPEA
ncbi:hypothetical protein Sango_2314600 [Sesamum angolense]|uniref:Transposase n=1 Tax=Sesamum angolense TaxID=2727404 RepID=A0AAE1WAX6_9LAMI|nr:hypothetical protein Sango_2314600 [Sesamum angolense]